MYWFADVSCILSRLISFGHLSTLSMVTFRSFQFWYSPSPLLFALCCTLGVLRCSSLLQDYKDTLYFVLTAFWFSFTMRTFISLRIFIYNIKKESSFIFFSFPFCEPVFPKLSIKCVLFLIYILGNILYLTSVSHMCTLSLFLQFY